jgi:hypothetical protein
MESFDFRFSLEFILGSSCVELAYLLRSDSSGNQKILNATPSRDSSNFEIQILDSDGRVKTMIFSSNNGSQADPWQFISSLREG